MLPSTTIIASKAAICQCCKSLPMRGGEAPLRSWPPSNPSPKCLCISTQLWEQKLRFFYYISPNQSAHNHTHASEDKSKRKMSLSAERGVIPVSVTPVKGAALCESIFWQHYHAVLMLASNQTLSGGDKVTREWNREEKLVRSLRRRSARSLFTPQSLWHFPLAELLSAVELLFSTQLQLTPVGFRWGSVWTVKSSNTKALIRK